MYYTKEEAQEMGVHESMVGKIIYASLEFENAAVMISDDPYATEGDDVASDRFAVNYSTVLEADFEHGWNTLAKEGTVTMEASEVFFADRFGAIRDKFGITWQLLWTTEEHKKEWEQSGSPDV